MDLPSVPQALLAARTTSPWVVRPVFVSSTFKDFHAERDCLRSVVFPELIERMLGLRCHLEPVDLRVGVETAKIEQEEAKELQVLKVCFSEIERSRPFLIAFLGDRYGWIPPESRVAAAMQEARFATSLSGKSVTALEIEYGLQLEDPESRRRCLFFLREPLPYETMRPEVAARYSDRHANDAETRALATRLDELKRWLESSDEFGSRTFRYRAEWDPAAQRVVGLEAFARLVAEKLGAELEAELRALRGSATRPSDPAQVERDAIDEFIETGSRKFVGRKKLADDLADYLRGETPKEGSGVYLAGSPGSGKSVLAAELARRLRKEPGALTLVHAAGITPDSTDLDRMLARWIGEIEGFLELPASSARTSGELEGRLASLLELACTKTPVAAIVDGVDRFQATKRSLFLAWLPEKLPREFRFLATGPPPSDPETLTQVSGIRVRELAALAKDDARAILETTYAGFHREPNREAIEVLASKRTVDGRSACESALWTHLAGEQINLLNEDDFRRAEAYDRASAGERLAALVVDVARSVPADLIAAHRWTLERAERDYGTTAVRWFALLIGASRWGLRETDLKELIPNCALLVSGEKFDLDGSALAGMRRAFRSQVVPQGPERRWNFSHPSVREAIGTSAFASHDSVRTAHAAIAAHLARLPEEDPLRQQEFLYHLVGCGEVLQAARYFANLAATHASGENAFRFADVNPEYVGAARMIVSLSSLPASAQGSFSHALLRLGWSLSEGEVESICWGYVHTVIAGLALCSIRVQRETADAVAEIADRLFRAEPQRQDRRLLSTLAEMSLGRCCGHGGDAGEAVRRFARGAVLAGPLTDANPDVSDYAQLYWSSLFEQARWISVAGNHDESLRLLGRARGFAETAVARNPNDRSLLARLASSHLKIGVALTERQEYLEAILSLLEAVRIDETLATLSPNDMTRQEALFFDFFRLAEAQRATLDAAGAVESVRRGREILRRLLRHDPANRHWKAFAGLMLPAAEATKVGSSARALRSISADAAHERLRRLVAQDPHDGVQRCALVESYREKAARCRDLGDHAAALRDLADAEALLPAAGLSDPYQRYQRVCIHSTRATVFYAMRRRNDALTEFRVAYRELRELTTEHPERRDWQMAAGTLRLKIFVLRLRHAWPIGLAVVVGCLFAVRAAVGAWHPWIWFVAAIAGFAAFYVAFLLIAVGIRGAFYVREALAATAPPPDG